MVILVRPLQPPKAQSSMPILVTPLGMVMLVRLLQLLKAESPMLITLFDMVILVKLRQP